MGILARWEFTGVNIVKTKNPPLGSVAVKTLRTWQVSFQWSRRRKAWLELNKQSSGISSSRKLYRYPKLPLLPPPDTQGVHTPHTLIHIYIPSTHSIPTHFTHTHTPGTHTHTDTHTLTFYLLWIWPPFNCATWVLGFISALIHLIYSWSPNPKVTVASRSRKQRSHRLESGWYPWGPAVQGSVSTWPSANWRERLCLIHPYAHLLANVGT